VALDNIVATMTLSRIVATMTLNRIIATMTLDRTVATRTFVTTVAFVISLVGVMTSSPVMWRKGHLSVLQRVHLSNFVCNMCMSR
jgi:hypothetical protein